MKSKKKVPEIQTQVKGEKGEIYLIGLLLKEAREEKNLTIADVAMETRIRQVYIKALEEGNLEEIPGKAYRIGFLKTYADFLELDVVEILRRLNLAQESRLNHNQNKGNIHSETHSRPSRKVLFLSILGVLIFSIVAYLTHNFQNQEKTVKLLQKPVPQDLETSVIIDQLPSLTEPSHSLLDEEDSEQEDLPLSLTSQKKDPQINVEKSPETDSDTMKTLPENTEIDNKAPQP